jgi:hypothetical protein
MKNKDSIYTENLSVISIDVGLRNLAICKEVYNIGKCKCIKPPSEFYDEFGESMTDMKRFIKEIGCIGKLVHFEKKDLGDKKCYYSGQTYFTLYEWLDDLCEKGLFTDVHTILIEQQLKTNNICISIMHHLHSYFLLKFKRYKVVVLYQSRNKTRVLGAALTKKSKEDGKLVKTTKYNRKVWSVKLITDLLSSRKDETSLKLLSSEKKKDDICDTVSQLLSYVVTEVFKSLKIKPVYKTLRGVKKENKQKTATQRLLES